MVYIKYFLTLTVKLTHEKEDSGFRKTEYVCFSLVLLLSNAMCGAHTGGLGSGERRAACVGGTSMSGMVWSGPRGHSRCGRKSVLCTGPRERSLCVTQDHRGEHQKIGVRGKSHPEPLLGFL